MRLRVLSSAWILLMPLLLIPVFGGEEKKIQFEPDIVFGMGGDIELKLDMARPEGKGPFPAIVCLHGGGWRSGQRQDLQPLVKELAKQGFVAVTSTYRLTDKSPFPAQIEDCKTAVRWLRANADKYNVRAKHIGAVGFSAGAHLACLLGTADDSAGLEGMGGHDKQSSRVQAVVSYFGPTDFATKTWNKQVEDFFLVPFFGGTYEEKRELYRKASPLQYVTKDDPPFLFFHGAKDTLVHIENSQKLAKDLNGVGVEAELVTMPEDGHGWGGEKMKKSVDQTVRFFEAKLKK